MSVTEEQRAKLPRWARDELERLEGNLAYHRERERARDAGETGVVVLAWPREQSWHLDDRASVQWTLPYEARDGRPATIEVTRDGESVKVSSSGGGLLVRPGVTNVVFVDVARRST